MADQVVPITPGSGTNVDVTELSVSGKTVERQRVNVAGAAAAELADVKNADPASTAYGVVVRSVGSPPTLSGAIANQVQVTASSAGTERLIAAPLAGMRRFFVQCDPLSPEGVRIGATGLSATLGIWIDPGASAEIDADAIAAANYFCWSAGGTGLINVLMRA